MKNVRYKAYQKVWWGKMSFLAVMIVLDLISKKLMVKRGFTFFMSNE